MERTITSRATAALLGLGLAVASAQLNAQAPAKPASTAQAGTVDTQALARDILMRMAHFIAQSPHFSVTLSTNYDAVQQSGQKIEFADRRKIVLSRPGRLRAEVERSDSARVSTVFTGKDIVLVDATNKVYASEPQPGGIDESVVHFVSDLGIRFPLAVLLMSRLPEELEKRMQSIDYVEKTNLLGTPAHHLAGRTDAVDFQVWVADGAQPVLLRVVITYRNEPGQPEFRADFTDWNFSPSITDATFAPQIPAGAQKIAFATQLAAAAKAAHKTPASAQGGEQ
jgi:hypothetical protein